MTREWRFRVPCGSSRLAGKGWSDLEPVSGGSVKAPHAFASCTHGTCWGRGCTLYIYIYMYLEVVVLGVLGGAFSADGMELSTAVQSIQGLF